MRSRRPVPSSARRSPTTPTCCRSRPTGSRRATAPPSRSIMSISTCARARCMRSSARTGRGRARSWGCSRAPCAPIAARCGSTASPTCRTRRSPRGERGSRSSTRSSRSARTSRSRRTCCSAPRSLVADGSIVRVRARARSSCSASSRIPRFGPSACVGELSLPARQIVEICRALAADARVVLMDEPTSSLQGADVERLFALIRRLSARGIAVIYISHFLEEVRQIADRYTVLRDGRSVASGVIAEVTNDDLIAKMVGRPATGLFPARQRAASADVALSVRDLSAPPRLAAASFDLREGRDPRHRRPARLGPHGARARHLCAAIAGRRHGGDWRSRPRGVAREHEGARARRRRLRQRRSQRRRARAAHVHRRQSLRDAADLCRCARSDCWTSRRSARRRAGGSPSSACARSRRGSRCARCPAATSRRSRSARLLHQRADILLLDEPTRGIDIGSKAEIYEIIARQADAGCAVLMVSSYLPELFGICDRIAVMCRGRLSEARPVAEWSPESVMAAAIGG